DGRQRIFGLEPDPALRESLIDAFVVAHRDGPLLVAAGRRLAPGHLDRRSGRARLVIALGDDADDVALADAGADAGHRARCGVVDLPRLCVAARRPDDRAAREALEAHVG